jgi:thiol-disulfide isomerase/thioredoxin
VFPPKISRLQNAKKGIIQMNTGTAYGIVGHRAPEFDVMQWIDNEGNKTAPLKLSDLDGKFKVVYCFQSWCAGCNSSGFPSLSEMTKALKRNDKVVFLAVQTVFEGHATNTYDKMVETKAKYGLNIPFGHDVGDDDRSTANIMKNYRTGGTPWFIFIDEKNIVVFNDFHLNTEKAIEYLKAIR